ncbi:MAG: hypothetical protein JWR80_4987 [Bradyrhizobium sp.]|nr:hypothetical protein [Bradyrhizobium sp.]
MSGHNAHLSLPRGDRDDTFPEVAPEIVLAVARKPLPDLERDIAQLQRAIEDAQLALAELRMARTQGNMPMAKSAAWRLCESLQLLDLRAITARVKRAVLAERARAA